MPQKHHLLLLKELITKLNNHATVAALGDFIYCRYKNVPWLNITSNTGFVSLNKGPESICEIK